MAPGRRTPSLSDEMEALRRELQQVRGTLPERINVDAEGVEQGLAQLVLTLIEFLRQVLERQAVRRMEGGSLSEEEVERVGLALMKLEEKVHELADQFGLRPSDLNINLGPLGDLL
jgi:gas vesicle protein GvpK